MKNDIYNKNGLIFFEELDILLRGNFVTLIVNRVKELLLEQNTAFQFIQIEAPILTPIEHVSEDYLKSDSIYTLSQDKSLALRPETTSGSYEAIKYLLSGYNTPKYRLPIVVWQHGKSFRDEQDQCTKFMRLKEFHQLEFQIVYSVQTANDYSTHLTHGLAELFTKLIGLCKIIPSDRQPSYSLGTTDIMHIKNNMEICSISKRMDFKDQRYKILEVAIGTDRLVYCINN